MKSFFITVMSVFIIVFFIFSFTLGAQDLEERVSKLEREVDSLASTGLVLYLFGIFCALWAQNTGRNSWGWFFLGLFFGPITVIFLLVRNAEYLKQVR